MSTMKIEKYGKLLGDWKIKKVLYENKNGTKVLQIYKLGTDWEENCALKIVPIIEDYGEWNQLSEEIKESYLEAKMENCKNAEKEVRLMYTLRGCSNIVSYYDFFFDDWSVEKRFGCDLLIRMELLECLRSYMHTKLFSEKEIVKIGTDICKALISCHKKDIIHRDIKPENIFINESGDYLLGDFGISRIVNNAKRASTSTGTVEYMAPEQLRENSMGNYGFTVDIYSLGLTLYELANGGKLPFAKSIRITHAENALRLSGKKLPFPSGVGEELANIILKACEYDSSKRYQSADDLLQDLIGLDRGRIKKEQIINEKKDFVSEIQNDDYATVPAETVISSELLLEKNDEKKTIILNGKLANCEGVFSEKAFVFADSKNQNTYNERIDSKFNGKRVDTSDNEEIEIKELLYEMSDVASLIKLEPKSVEEQKHNSTSYKIKGHLVSSYRRVVDVSKYDYKQPVEILMPDGTNVFFDFCDEFTVSNQKRYIVVRQENDDGEYLFLVFRNRNGKMTLLSGGQDQRKVYRWFRRKYVNEYIFTDNNDVLRVNKKKHFAQDTAPKYFPTSNEIPQILNLPQKYIYISSNAFIKLKPDNKAIRQIVISDSVEVIEDNAFAGLVVTEAIHIPNSVKKIGQNAFSIKEGAYVYCEENSRAYKYFSEKDDVKVIKDVPFKRTVGNKIGKILEEMLQSKNITRIEEDTVPFDVDKTEIGEIVVPVGICVIDSYALYHVKIKNRIVIPSSVTRIGSNAFNLMPEAYVECEKGSYAYLYCKERGIRNSVDFSIFYKSKCVCTYCGGRFVGVFRKKCSLCGKEK